MPTPSGIELTIRGRGTRLYVCGAEFLTSPGGLGVPVMTPVRAIRPGDWVGIEYGGRWSPQPAALPALVDRPRRGSEKAIRVPGVMTTELAFLFGAYLAEGHTTSSNWSVILTNSVMTVLERARAAWHDEFALNARITRQPGRCTGLVVSSKRLVEYMDELAMGSRAANKAVPSCILTGTREHALDFLQGAALDAYTTTVSASKWAICLESSNAIDGLQDLLTKLGIHNAQIPKFNKQVQKTYFELYAPGRDGQELCRLVPFLEPDKAVRAEAYVAASIGGGNGDVVPGITGHELYGLVPRGTSGRNGKGSGRQALRHLCDSRTTRVSRASVQRARAAGAVLPDWLGQLLDTHVTFAPLVRQIVAK